MGYELVTGFRPPEDEGHVTPEQDAGLYATIFGKEDCVLPFGNQAKATLSSANEIHIGSGILLMQGREIWIDASGVTVQFESGTQAMKRNDILVATYTSTGTEDGIVESVIFEVVKGDPDPDIAQDPELTTGDLFAGAVTHQMALYRIALDGISVGEPVALFETFANPIKSALNAEKRNSSYLGMILPDGTDVSWLRTTQSGLIPYSAGQGALGSASWPFRAAYANNYYIGSTLITDYVVERGNSGGWGYIKFNSGLAMCWRRTSSSYSITQSTNSGLYRSTTQYASPTYPFGFSATPTFTATAAGDVSGVFITFAASSGQALWQGPNYRLYAPVSGSATIAVSFQAMGRWK